MSDVPFDPLDYEPQEIDLSDNESLQIPQDDIDAIMDKIDEDMSNAQTVKEVLHVLKDVGSFVLQVGLKLL